MFHQPVGIWKALEVKMNLNYVGFFLALLDCVSRAIAVAWASVVVIRRP